MANCIEDPKSQENRGVINENVNISSVNPIVVGGCLCGASFGAKAASATSATITWTVIPSSGCSTADYLVRAYGDSGHRLSTYTAVGANSQSFTGLQIGTYHVEVWTFCWTVGDYSSSPATTSVTISSSSQPTPTIPDNSLGTAKPANVSASANSGEITVTWTNAIGQTAPTGYCDVTDYSVKVRDSDGSAVQHDDYITAGTWTSNAVTTGANYEVGVTAYSAECDGWSGWQYVDVWVSS